MAFYSLGSSVQPYNILDRYIAPWQNFHASPQQQLAYFNDPSMGQSAYMNTLNRSGEGAISSDFYNYLQGQMGDYWNKFKGWQTGLSQEDAQSGNFGWDRYMRDQDVFQDYMNTNPYAGIARLSRPTRFNIRR